MAKMAELADQQTQALLDEVWPEEPETFVVFSHCASGYRELEYVETTKEKAIARGRQVLRRSPVTACGTGGVRWCEVFGPGIEESIGVERSGDLIVVTGG